MDRLTWNGVSWFVSVEWALCLLFPLLLWLASNRPWRGALLILAGLAGLTALDLASPHGLDITYHNGVLRGLSDFSCGVGMAILFRVLKPRDRLGEAGHSILQLALVTALFYAAYHTGWSHTHADIWMVLPMMALVLALAFDRGLVARALHARLFQKVGAWSYAIYLGQTVWLLGIRFFEQRLYPDPDTMVLGMRFSTLIWGLEPVGLLLLCLIWGALLAIFVEHPAAKALRPLLDRRSPATPP